jgi:hypothetical protein
VCRADAANGVTTKSAPNLNADLTQVFSDRTNVYLYRQGRIGQYQTAMRYLGADALGSVRQMYNTSGQVISNNRDEPYGSTLTRSGATSVYGFTGEQTDATELACLRPC